MRIAIDASAVGRRKGGDETFMRGLVEGLAADGQGHTYYAYTAVAPPPAWRRLSPSLYPRRLTPGAGLLRMSLRGPVQVARDRIDVYQSPLACPPLCTAASVLYLPDVSFLMHPEHYPLLLRRRLQALSAASSRASGAVMTLSHNARDEIVRRFPFDRAQVHVVYPGIDHHRFHLGVAPPSDEMRRRYDLPERYILYVGSINPRKNLVTLVQAHERARAEELNLAPLVVVGADRWLARDTYAGIGDRSDVRFIGYAPDEDLPALYKGAEMFAFPSLVEGFGLPPLEAMACGVPVVASTIPVFAEVYGDAYEAVHPRDVRSIADGLLRLTRDRERRRALIERGPARAARYTWAAAARAAVPCYEAAHAAQRCTVWRPSDLPRAVRYVVG